MMTETLRFKGDSALRRRFFVPESFQHPAKMASGLVLECIERYTNPGDWCLDLMAGSGTLLLGAMYGRNLILNELERHFVLPMVESWAKIQQNGPALGYSMGEVLILQGDARALPLLDGDVAAVITSPPYEGSMDHQAHGIDGSRLQAPYGPNSQFAQTQGYTRPVDAVITSPPYEGSMQNGETPDEEKALAREARAREKHPERPVWRGYTRPVDAVITSPPYEGLRQDGGVNELSLTKQDFHSYTDGITTKAHEARSNKNIGNMRGSQYWEAMAAVYRECWRVLKPGGIMALVLKGFTKNKEYIDLPDQTEALLLGAGWVKHDEWRRELWNLSFWRTLQKRRSPETFDDRLNYETVMAFRKGHTPMMESEGH